MSEDGFPSQAHEEHERHGHGVLVMQDGNRCEQRAAYWQMVQKPTLNACSRIGPLQMKLSMFGHAVSQAQSSAVGDVSPWIQARRSILSMS
jgi:hypothetical protein